MKKIQLTILAMAGSLMICAAHGPGHLKRESATLVNEATETNLGGTTGHEGHTHATSSETEKSFCEVEPAGGEWGASLTTGFQSRHVHYGINESGNSGVYMNEVGVWAGNFVFNVWSGFALGNDFQEWDFSAAYNLDLGPVFLLPGYNLRYLPEGTSEEEAHEGEESHEEEGHAVHQHKTYGNELFLVVGTNVIPYVVPSVAFICDLNNLPGGLMEFRIDGEVPVWKDIVTLEPYALLALNFGYNTKDSYSWNNFQFGLQGNWQITKILSAFAGVNYSMAMTALNDIGQGNEFWVNAGVGVEF